MMRAIQLALVCFTAFVAMATHAHGGIITYTDRTAFEAAAGTLTNFNFNSSPVGTFNSSDFGDFTASKTDAELTIGVAAGGAFTNVNGSNHLFFTADFTQSPLTLTFDTAISAFGFDWRTTDSTSDGLDLVIDGILYTISPASPASGFFGIIDDAGTFSVVELQDDVDGGGFNEGVGFDNLSFGQAAPVPEPASIAVFSIAACITAAGAARKRHFEKTQLVTV